MNIIYTPHRLILTAALAGTILVTGCAVWTSQDQGDIQTARSLTCNALTHLAGMDASVGARVEEETARDILNNTLHHHNVDLDAGACP